MSENCKIYTPKEMVKKLLSLCGYKNKLILGKHVLDNSCGQGAILKEVVTNYIKAARRIKMNDCLIKKDLETFIHGYDIDQKAIDVCVSELNIIAQQFGIYDVEWNIHCTNFLNIEHKEKYDYIIANPPYINYTDIDEEERSGLKKFSTCNFGKYDYYYAFIEAGIKSMVKDASMVYIVPNSFLKNNSGKELRRCIKPFLTDLIDLSEIKVFKNATVSTCIIKLEKRNTEVFKYSLASKHVSKVIKKEDIEDKYLYEINTDSEILTFGEIFNVFSSVATLLNKAFLISSDSDIDLSELIIRPAASPKNLNYNKEQHIIFPYSFDKQGMLIKYTEDEMIQLFPSCYNHLLLWKDDLENRDSDQNTKFYEYGRSQALTKINCNKILVSTIVTNNIKCYLLDKNTIPYSGLVITEKGNGYSLNLAKDILESPDFFNYINNVAVSANGVSKRISSKDIINYNVRRVLCQM